MYNARAKFFFFPMKPISANDYDDADDDNDDVNNDGDNDGDDCGDNILMFIKWLL